jgi:hypothetical protein
MGEQISVPGTDSETKKDGDAEPRQTGMALEIDVLKKAHHQLSRLEDNETSWPRSALPDVAQPGDSLRRAYAMLHNVSATPRVPNLTLTKTDDEFGF